MGIVRSIWLTVASRACSNGHTTRIEYIDGWNGDLARGLAAADGGTTVVAEPLESGVLSELSWLEPLSPRRSDGSASVIGGVCDLKRTSESMDEPEEVLDMLVREERSDGSELPDEAADEA